MKKILTFLLLSTMFMSSLSFALPKSNDEVVLNVGHGDGLIAYEYLNGEVVKGPISFTVLSNGNIYVLDDVDKQVEIFNKNGDSIQTINIENNQGYYDMEIRENKNIVLLSYSGNLIEYNKNGEKVSTKKVEGLKEKHVNMTQLIKNKGNRIALRNHLNGTDRCCNE